MNPENAQGTDQPKVQMVVNFELKASYEVKLLAEALVKKIKGVPVHADPVKQETPIGLQNKLEVVNDNLRCALDLLSALANEFED